MGSKGRSTEARRLAILEAATEVFTAKGLDGALLDEVAARARVSKSSIYDYADSKQDLFYKAVRHRLDYEMARVEAAFRKGDDPAACLRAVIRASMPTRKEPPGFYALIFGVHSLAIRDPSFGAKMRDYRLERLYRFRYPLRDVLLEGVRRQIFRADLNVDEGADALAAWVHLMWLEWVIFPERTLEYLRRRADAHVDYVLGLYQRQAPPPGRP